MIPTVQTVFFSLVLQGDSATKNKESQCWLNQGLQAGARARSTIARGVGVLTPVEGDTLGRACLLLMKAMCWAVDIYQEKRKTDSLCLICKVRELLLKEHFLPACLAIPTAELISISELSNE